MNVAELIEQLKLHPDDFKVEIYGVVGPTPSDWGFLEVESVEAFVEESVIIE